MTDDMTRQFHEPSGDGLELLNVLANLLDGQPCGEDCPDCARPAQPEGIEDTEVTASALAAEITAVEAHLGRIDTKAGLLLGLTGAAATAVPVLLSGTYLPTPGIVAAELAVSFFTAAVTLLALAIRPRLVMRSRQPHGFMAYAGATPAQILASVTDAQQPQALAARLADLSAAAVGKYRQIRLAVDLALTGLVCVASASAWLVTN